MIVSVKYYKLWRQELQQRKVDIPVNYMNDEDIVFPEGGHPCQP